jgi:class 3 adenylate cyclase
MKWKRVFQRGSFSRGLRRDSEQDESSEAKANKPYSNGVVGSDNSPDTNGIHPNVNDSWGTSKDQASRLQVKVVMKENESLRQQLVDVRADRKLLRELLQETRQDLETTRSSLQARMEAVFVELKFINKREQEGAQKAEDKWRTLEAKLHELMFVRHQEQLQAWRQEFASNLVRQHNVYNVPADRVLTRSHSTVSSIKDRSVGDVLDHEKPSESKNKDHDDGELHDTGKLVAGRSSEALTTTELERNIPQNAKGHEPGTTRIAGFVDDLPKEDAIVREAIEFDRSIVDNVQSLNHSIQMLRRTRAVAVVTKRMTLAKTEKQCYEEVSRLLVALFNVDRCSYSLFAESENFVILRCATSDKQFSMTLPTNKVYPVKGSSYEKVKETGEMMYAPNLSKSLYYDHKMIASMGLNTAVNAPIYLNGSTLYGCLNVAVQEENGFTEHDRLLLKDIALSLGDHVYLKRLNQAEKESHKVSQQLLHSLIPAKVISKIQHFWKEGKRETRQTQDGTSHTEQDAVEEKEYSDDDEEDSDFKDRYELLRGKLKMLTKVNIRRCESSNNISLYQLPSLEDTPQSPNGINITKALYAEDAKNVTIIFADIVGFSKSSMNLKPMKVMDMLQDLFSRFDEMCERHGVLKLETIGDAFLAATGLMEDGIDAGTAPSRALAFAKDLVRQSQGVKIPVSSAVVGLVDSMPEFLNVRVGIHSGDITCGVLGQNVPKFSVFGHAVNMAARMESTCEEGRIHVTDSFYGVVKVGESESDWQGPKMTSVKNIGEVASWSWNPNR